MFGEKGGGWLHMATYVVININQTCSEQELDKPSLIPRLPTFFDCVKEKGKPGRTYHMSDVRVDR